MQPKPITLIGNHIRLEPLSLHHLHPLTQVALDPRIWQYMIYGPITTPKDLQNWIQELLNRQQQGTDLPFTINHLPTNLPIGCTRYLEIRPQHRSLEIGGTWLAIQHQRTPANTEAKYLLLKHAFEDLHCIRVQFKTDQRNLPSQRAIQRLGAVQEGTLRNHLILPDGTIRNSIYYSILDTEWQTVKTHLQNLLNRP